MDKNITNFTATQIERYSRHIILPGVGGKGQQKLLNSRVLIIGIGAAGSPAALYLAAAGTGTLGIADSRKVQLSNLQNEIIHPAPSVDHPKIESAEKEINELNPDVRINKHQVQLTSENLLRIIKQYDFVVDASPEAQQKYLVNDACVLAKIPFSTGSIYGFKGHAMTILPYQTACYRCATRKISELQLAQKNAEVPIFNVVGGTIGIIQATEAIKHLLGIGNPLTNTLLLYDSLELRYRSIKVEKDPRCNICSGQQK